MRTRGCSKVLFALAAAIAATQPSPARARPAGAILHEPIPPDPQEDLAMHVALDGDLPAALHTQTGAVSAPDPRQLPSPSDTAYGPAQGQDSFVPDRDTKRPDVSGYDEPFTPSTAPFKRLEAFDGVRDDYQLYVHEPQPTPVTVGGPPPGSDEEAFYADLVVDIAPERNVRIPSVGPGARIVRARLGVGAQDIGFRVLHDGADNWFVQPYGTRSAMRARFVMELAIARSAFGGQLNDPSWSELPFVPPLPDAVARDAAQVRAAIGVGRELRPREAIARMVQYFRGFADSEDPPRGQHSIYLDLALSKKGVCRHRAFAFLVTAQSLGIPTRMVLNEAHAWVEVHDGTLWKRIDLGGAGRMTSPASSSMPERAVYRPPPDSFSWPQNAERGDDMVADARARASSGGGGPSPGGSASSSASAPPAASASSPAAALGSPSSSDRDDRPPAVLTLSVTDADPHRGLPLHVRGEVRAEGEPCAHVAVEVWLRDPKTQKMILLGSLATGDDGTYAGGIVVPGATPLGDYDVVGRTPGDARCGSGASN